MILVVGSGVAGLSAALAASARGAAVELVTPGTLSGGTDALAGGNTQLAQGGVAAAIPPGDSAAAHLADTRAAGAGLVDDAAARVLTAGGVTAVRALLADGFAVDRGLDGEPLYGLEGAHGVPRIVHAGGDRTGAELHAHLASRVLGQVAAGRITLTERTRLVALLEEGGAVTGATLRRDAVDGAAVGSRHCEFTRRAAAVVLATGGYAALFPRHTNTAGARGEGILAAARAGALLADLEFVQFHPTALASGALISEAVRGQGAVLRDAAGRAFMAGRHEARDLAPRDVVSREIHRVMRDEAAARSSGAPHASGATGADAAWTGVWLDATGVEREGGPGTLARRFPGIHQAVAAHGLDWTRDPIPVAPAAHYTMGGVLSDRDGRTTVPGLFVAGEAAATGVHGANRLASNSLLEGLVFGERAGAAAHAFTVAGARDWQLTAQSAALLAAALPCETAARAETGASEDAEVTAAIASGLGIERDAAGLAAAARVFATHSGDAAALAALVCTAATERRESRGAHQRADFPEPIAACAERRALLPVHPAPAVPPAPAAAPTAVPAAAPAAPPAAASPHAPPVDRSIQRSSIPC